MHGCGPASHMFSVPDTITQLQLLYTQLVAPSMNLRALHWVYWCTCGRSLLCAVLHCIWFLAGLQLQLMAHSIVLRALHYVHWCSLKARQHHLYSLLAQLLWHLVGGLLAPSIGGDLRTVHTYASINQHIQRVAAVHMRTCLVLHAHFLRVCAYE
jgi:hypothetical protein